jgi:protein TonB
VELYTPREIALATGVEESAVLDALGAPDHVAYVPHSEAVRIGRMLVVHARVQARTMPPGLFSTVAEAPRARRPLLGFAVSGSVHAVGVVLVLLAGLTLAPATATLRAADQPVEPMRLVFLSLPGPGGGGGGGGLHQRPPAPKALREGLNRVSSPVPLRREPEPMAPAPARAEPKPEPLKSEQLPVVVAPIVTAPADARNRIGVLAERTMTNDSHGSGTGAGAGTGAGTGLGAGEGSGIGPGSDGGIGGGPFRPGSGIQPPRLIREIKADYTEEARQRNIAGEVVLEIVVRRDGTVGDVRVRRGLSGGLNERAVQAVRQWKFTPAQRLGSPVDVIVEVAVEFKLR